MATTMWARASLGIVTGALAIGLLAGWAGPVQHASSPVALVSKRPVQTVEKPSHKSPGVTDAWANVPSVRISRAPGAPPFQAIGNRNNLGAPLVMLVRTQVPGWVEVYLPERPNESLGWVPTSDVRLVSQSERIVVSLSTRHLELFKGSRLAYQATVAVGSPESPTPTGYFYVTEVLKITNSADNPYGPDALGLSGFSNTFYSFEGGPGQIAIHGTDQPWVIGQYASHGCVRLDNPDIAILASQVEPGTPVWIIG